MDQALTLLRACVAVGWSRELSGYFASALVLATFSMRSMNKLRLSAIASNVAFIFYALVASLNPILVLHCILLPLNIFRLLQASLEPGTTRRARVAVRRALSGRPARRTVVAPLSWSVQEPG